MAELNKQPNSNNYWWLWLFVLLIIGGALYLYLNNKQDNKTQSGTKITGPISHEDDDPFGSVSSGSGPKNSWDGIDFNAPDTIYAEVSDQQVAVKSNAQYVIYSLSTQNVFSGNQSELSNEGKQGLNQIGASINQRYHSADIKIYDKAETKQPGRLSEERAESIANYLIHNSNIDQRHLTFYYTDHASPESGKNNTVNIVVKR